MRTNLFKLVLLSFFLLSIGIVKAQDDKSKISPENEVHKKEGKTDGIKQKDGILYGKNVIKKKKVIAISKVAANPEKYKGKQVTLKGTVADVCQKAGCWMVLTDGKNEIRILTNHEFFLPKDCFDKNVILTGKFDIVEVSEEDARHYADESDRAKIKGKDISGVQKWMTIDAEGVKILNESNGKGGGVNEKPKKHSKKKHKKCSGKDCCKGEK